MYKINQRSAYNYFYFIGDRGQSIVLLIYALNSFKIINISKLLNWERKLFIVIQI